MLPTNQTFHSSITAAVLLLGKELASQWDWPTTEKILELTGASKSQAYAMASRLRTLLGTLLAKPGRPTAEPAPGQSLLAVSRAIQDYLMRHPGAASVENGRYGYSDGFRRFIVGLVEPGEVGEGLSAAQLAEASSIPLGTLKSWFAQPRGSDTEVPAACSLRQEHHHQILSLYSGWQGTFVAFCKMLRREHRINYGDTAIRTLLHQAGLRRRATKESTPNRGSYQKMFPGAQWLGDGSAMKVHHIPVQWDSQTFTFNLEVMLDVSSNALVGIAVSDTENEAAVLSAFQDGRATTGQAPLALSLDNKPCNHTPAIAEATAEANTSLLATTPFRPTSKAPLEGFFGLFKQSLPDITLSGDSPRELARCVLHLVASAWARGRNGRPRRNLGGKSPAEAYLAAKPSPEEVAKARREIEELRRKQEAIRRTREERANPIKLAFLRQALADLGIADPDHRLAVSLAYFPLDSIVDAIGIFQTKRQLGTIPEDADPGRYLRGIIRKRTECDELTLAAEFHLKNRLRLRDLSLQRLVRQEQKLQLLCSGPEQLLTRFLDRALQVAPTIDYHFWVLRSSETLAAVPIDKRTALYQAAARRIAVTFQADPGRKQSLLARLARTVSE